MEKKYRLFFILICFGSSFILGKNGSRVLENPFKDADTYLTERRSFIEEIDTYERKEQNLDQAKKEKLEDLSNRTETLKDLLKTFEDSYQNYEAAVDNNALSEQNIALQNGTQVRMQIDEEFDPIKQEFEPLKIEIDKLSSDVSKATSEIPTSSTKKMQEKKKEIVEQEEDPVISSFIESIIEYLQVTFLAQWFGELYVSLPEFGWRLFVILFGQPEIDWSPLESSLTQEQITQYENGQEPLSASQALQLLNTLQNYKTYFLILAQNPQNNIDQIQKIGDTLNKTLYAIDKQDPKAISLISGLPQSSVFDTFISEIMILLKEIPELSSLTVSSPASLSQTSSQLSDAVDKTNFLIILKTLQRLESALLVTIAGIVSKKITLTDEKRNSFLQLLNSLNQIGLKIMNNDASVFNDLLNINKSVTLQIQSLPNKLEQDQTFAQEFQTITSLLKSS